MKFQVFILFAYLLAVSVAEPPVRNGYPLNHHHDHYANDYQRSQPPQDYGVPNPQSFGQPQDFGQARSSNAAYPPIPNSLPQEYGAPRLRNGISQDYGPPGLRNGPGSSRNLPTAEYGVPNERPEVMDSYSAPIHGSVANSNARMSEDYGVPNQRDFGLSSPSQEYGTPFRSNPSQKYGVPASRAGYPQQSATSNSLNSFDASKGYNRGLPKSFTSSKSVSTFNSPSLRSSSSSQYQPASRSSNDGFSSPVDSYAPPSSNYGVPSQTSAIASSFQSPRGLSSSYGVPKGLGVSESYGPPVIEARSSPSQEYGVPERSNQRQGYNYENVRKALEELQNQEPANYDFAYKVNDFGSGSDFGHTETRQDNRAEGSYFVLLPDGTKQTVQYEADEQGFKPRISVESINDGSSSGYDENAANIQTKNGPY